MSLREAEDFRRDVAAPDPPAPVTYPYTFRREDARSDGRSLRRGLEAIWVAKASNNSVGELIVFDAGTTVLPVRGSNCLNDFRHWRHILYILRYYIRAFNGLLFYWGFSICWRDDSY